MRTGILTQAQKAKEETEEVRIEEENALTKYEQIINVSVGVTLETITGYETSNTVTQDSLGNRVVVPAGFKVVNPGDNVEDGIIIEDVAYEKTKESQFVWIPVGKDIKKKDGTTFDIKLSRYTFNENGIATDQENKLIEEYYQELNVGTENMVAKENIESEQIGFRGSAIKNGGFYIARYEARTGTKRNSQQELTGVTVKQNDYVYNYITQPQAAELSREMYDTINFESDLVNSYAWDTAIDFLQKCDNRVNKGIPYSQVKSLNTGTLAEKGTNNQENKDIICNVYDMASNCREFTTESSNFDSFQCVYRGGYFITHGNNIYTSGRASDNVQNVHEYRSFRPIIYIKF